MLSKRCSQSRVLPLVYTQGTFSLLFCCYSCVKGLTRIRRDGISNTHEAQVRSKQVSQQVQAFHPGASKADRLRFPRDNISRQDRWSQSIEYVSIWLGAKSASFKLERTGGSSDAIPRQAILLPSRCHTGKCAISRIPHFDYEAEKLFSDAIPSFPGLGERRTGRNSRAEPENERLWQKKRLLAHEYTFYSPSQTVIFRVPITLKYGLLWTVFEET